MMNNYRTRKCRECAAEFQGGPRAWYCPKCRKARQQKVSAESKARRRRGLTRKIGSVDYCVVCRQSYEVDGPNQRYCKKCAPVEIKKVAAKQSLEYYKREKETINPKRSLDRKKGLSTCAMCGKEFPTRGVTKYCSEECRDKARRFSQAISDAKRGGYRVPTAPPEDKRIDWSGVDWSKPVKVIAEEMGRSIGTVSAARKRFSGSVHPRLDWEGIDWNKSNREIAQETGRNYRSVVSSRIRLTKRNRE